MRNPGVHFVRFQDFPAESRKSEFFTIARTTTVANPSELVLSFPSPSSALMHLEVRWNLFRKCNIPRQIFEPLIDRSVSRRRIRDKKIILWR